jgi:hypothetical protein
MVKAIVEIEIAAVVDNLGTPLTLISSRVAATI